MCCGKTFLGLNLLAFISIVFQWPEQAQIVCEGEREGGGVGVVGCWRHWLSCIYLHSLTCRLFEIITGKYLLKSNMVLSLC